MRSSAWGRGIAVGFAALAMACSGSEPSATAPAPQTTAPAPQTTHADLAIAEVAIGVDGRTLGLTSRPMQVGSCGQRRVPETGTAEATVSGDQVIVVLRLPATRDGEPRDGDCADLMLGSVSASVALAEPFEGKTLLDRTSGLRLALTPAGLVRVGPLAPEGWSTKRLRGLLAEQAFVEELTSGGRVISFQQALDRPPRSPSEHVGAGDEATRRVVNGVPAVLTLFRDPTSTQPDLVLRWRPGRHGLTLLTWSDLSTAGASTSLDPIDEGALLNLAERIGALAAEQGPAADASEPPAGRETPVAIERVRLEPDGLTLTLSSSAWSRGCDPVDFAAAVTREGDELRTLLTMVQMSTDIPCG